MGIPGKENEKGQTEKQTACKEPDEGLEPGNPGSHPEQKAGAQPLSHPGVPCYGHFQNYTKVEIMV